MLARGALYQTNVKGQLCRVCFKNYNLLGITKKIKQIKTNQLNLECFPNCPIKNNQIVYEKELPISRIEEFSQDLKINFTIDQSSLKSLHENKQCIKKSAQCVGQLFIFYMEKDLCHYQLVCGTAFYCSFKKNILITALHCINEYSITYYDKLLYISFNEEDLLYTVQGIWKQFQKQTKGQLDSNKEMKLLKNKLEQLGCEQVFIDENFLEHRKQWILKQKSNFVYLDPISRLKMSPVCDVALLKFNNTNKNSSLMPINSLIQKQQLQDNIYIIAYNDEGGYLDQKEEYFNTIPLINAKLAVQMFLQEGKSVSGGILHQFTAGIICFQSSVSVGSSGGPILNSNGYVIGINTGNYSENNGQLAIDNNDPATFDIKFEEKKQFYQSQKNYSLGVNIRHPMLIEYLENKNEKKSRPKTQKKKLQNMIAQVQKKKICKNKGKKTTKAKQSIKSQLN